MIARAARMAAWPMRDWGKTWTDRWRVLTMGLPCAGAARAGLRVNVIGSVKVSDGGFTL
ncbi:MAG: hypothetical protein OHK0018_13150 [Erythrobacter tepidarius]